MKTSKKYCFFLTVLSLSLLITLPLTAQEGEKSQPFSFSAPSTGNLLSEPVARAEVSAKIGAWDPETRVGILTVDYRFPSDYYQTDSTEFFTFEVAALPGITFSGVLKPKPVFTDGLPNFYKGALLAREFRVSQEVSPAEFDITAKFQICNKDGTCLFPDEEKILLLFDPAMATQSPGSELQQILDYAESKTETEGDFSPAESSPSLGVGKLFYFILLAFLGGILLNIMPCVLPLLSVKALGLVKQAGNDRRAILAHSWLYVAGIEFSFLILGALVTILKASGLRLGWGFQFQEPRFVLILAAMVWLFALSLFNLYIIKAPGFGVKGAAKAGSRGGLGGSFLTGIFAVLIATPCTAPLLGTALGFAFSQPAPVIFLLFMVIGLGLGLPFLLLGLRPGIIEKLPKPGNWMRTFETIMGFLLTGTTVYLLTTLFKQAPSSMPGVLWWFLFMSFSAWLFGWSQRPLHKRIVRLSGTFLSLVLVTVSGIFLISLPDKDEAAGVTSYQEEGVLTFQEDEVEALLALQTPVFLEFTASWCTTCKINQRVIQHPDIREIMAARGIQHIKGDLTLYDETMSQWLARFGRAGVPLYVLFAPGQEPLLLPELLSKDRLSRAFKTIPLKES